MALFRCGTGSAVTLVGTYSADAAIDISAYGNVSVTDFLVVCDTALTCTAEGTAQSIQSVKGVAVYTPAALSIAGTTLNLTVPTLQVTASSSTGYYPTTHTENYTVKLYKI